MQSKSRNLAIIVDMNNYIITSYTLMSSIAQKGGQISCLCQNESSRFLSFDPFMPEILTCSVNSRLHIPHTRVSVKHALLYAMHVIVHIPSQDIHVNGAQPLKD